MKNLNESFHTQDASLVFFTSASVATWDEWAMINALPK